MAYKMSEVGGWGTGALGDITNPAGQVNSYANVTAINTNTVTIGTASNGIYETFAVGKEILLHVSAITSGTDYQYLGKYIVATITGVAGSVLTLSKDVSGLIASGVLANHHVQAITVAQFDTLNLSATIAPRAYSTTDKHGGIICFKCKTALNLSGSGKIDLASKGIPVGSIALRPATAQETNANQMGWENHITVRNLYLNCPDGVAVIAAKTLVNAGTSTLIGGATAGVAQYPYTFTVNYDRPSNTNVIGGPTIMIIAETINGFSASLISKKSSNTSGRGLGRCYIATESQLYGDELLYALDCISNPTRLKTLGIKDYGTGALGDITNPLGQINSYANVTAISMDGRTLTIGPEYAGVFERLESGISVVMHVSRQKASDQRSVGKFIQARILSAYASTVLLDKSVYDVLPVGVLSDYRCQLVTVAQFNNLTCAVNYTGAKAYSETHGCGGIVAIAVKDTFDLTNGKINMEGKGIPATVARPAVLMQCSGQQKDYLPLSHSSGAVLLFARKMIINTASRIGAVQNGNAYAGAAGLTYAQTASYGGQPGIPLYGGGVKRPGISPIVPVCYDTYSGLAGLKGVPGDNYAGLGGDAGPSIFAVFDIIDGMNICTFSTGGLRGLGGGSGDGYFGYPGTPGGAGYGGGGGGNGNSASGGQGGGPGTCFIYVNTIINPDYTAYLAS